MMMMIRKYLLWWTLAFSNLILLSSCQKEVVSADYKQETWFKKLNGLKSEWARQILITQDGGYLLLATTDEHRDVLIIMKLDDQGSEVAVNYVQMKDWIDPQATPLANGNFLINGLYLSCAIIVDQNGRVLSQKEYSTNFRTYSIPREGKSTMNYISNSSGFFSYTSTNYIESLNASGNKVSSQEFSNTIMKTKILSFFLHDIEELDTQITFSIIGAAYTKPNFNWSDPQKVYFAKVNSNGDVLKMNVLGVADAKDDSDIISYLSTTDKDVVVLAMGTRTRDKSYFELIKGDKNQEVVWRKKFRLNDIIDLYPNSVKLTSQGHYLVTGECTVNNRNYISPFFFLVSKTGEVLQQKIYDFSTSVSFTDGISHPKGGFVFTGYLFGYGKNKELADVFLLKTDESGNYH